MTTLHTTLHTTLRELPLDKLEKLGEMLAAVANDHGKSQSDNIE
jgi:hypothetical protein